jgi:transposase-like protein
MSPVYATFTLSCPTCGEVLELELAALAEGAEVDCPLCGEHASVPKRSSWDLAKHSWEQRAKVVKLVLDERRSLSEVAGQEHLPDELVREWVRTEHADRARRDLSRDERSEMLVLRRRVRSAEQQLKRNGAPWPTDGGNGSSQTLVPQLQPGPSGLGAMRLSAAPAGTVRLFEQQPPSRSRWWCNLDGEPLPGVEGPEEAVEWGLARGKAVVVRTLGGLVYWAGQAPEEALDEGGAPRPWPPSAEERTAIESAYGQALLVARHEQTARAAYRSSREDWLRQHAPELAQGEASHQCLVLLPATDGLHIELEELDPIGSVCGGRRQLSGEVAFGPLAEVLAVTSGRGPGDPWVLAASEALVRERNWKGVGRRQVVEVTLGAGELNHVSAASNRESIRRHGLDWRRMGAVPGVAGSKVPELAAVFLGQHPGDIEFFTRMARRPCDAWAVRADGLWVENEPSGWLMISQPVPPDRLRLIASDIVPARDEGNRTR